MDSLWHLKISATGLYTDGNSPKSLLTNKINASKIGQMMGLLSNNTYQYGTIGKSKTVVYNDIRSENSLLFWPHSQILPFTRWYLETNVIRKIKFRNEIAAGWIYKISGKKKQVVNIFVAGANQQTTYKDSVFNLIDNHGSTKRNVWKGIAGISGYNTIVKDRLSIVYKAFLTQSLSDLVDYAYSIETTLDFKISNRFSLTGNYFLTYENIEPQGVLPKELQISYGLSYSL